MPSSTSSPESESDPASGSGIAHTTPDHEPANPPEVPAQSTGQGSTEPSAVTGSQQVPQAKEAARDKKTTDWAAVRAEAAAEREAARAKAEAERAAAKAKTDAERAAAKVKADEERAAKEAAKTEEEAAKAAAAETAAMAERKRSLEEGQNEVRKSLVGIRHVLENIRRITGDSRLSTTAKGLLEGLLNRFDQISNAPPDAVIAEAAPLHLVGGAWHHGGQPLVCGTDLPPGVEIQLTMPPQTQTDLFDEATRTAFLDATTGAQFIVGDGGHPQAKRWAQEEELKFFTVDGLARLREHPFLISVLGLNRSVMVFLKVLQMLMEEERGILALQEQLLSGCRKAVENGGPFELKERIKELRHRLDAELEDYLEALIRQKTDTLIALKEGEAKDLDKILEKYHEERRMGNAVPLPLLHLHRSAGHDASTPDDVWTLDKPCAQKRLEQGLSVLQQKEGFSFREHVLDTILRPELKRMTVDLNFLSTEEVPSPAVETTPAAVNQAPQPPAKNWLGRLLEGLRQECRCLFTKHPERSQPGPALEDSDPVWNTPASPARSGRLPLMGGLIKEAGAKPMKVLGPVLLIFAPLMILGIPNPIKNALKGVSDAVEIPPGFLSMVLLTGGITIALLTALRAAWKHATANARPAGSRAFNVASLPLWIIVVWGLLLGLGLLSTGVKEDSKEKRTQKMHEYAVNTFQNFPDLPALSCSVWSTQFRELLVQLGVDKAVQATIPDDATANDDNNAALDKVVNQWQAAAATLKTKAAELSNAIKAKETAEDDRNLASKHVDFYEQLKKFAERIAEIRSERRTMEWSRPKYNDAAWETGVHPLQYFMWFKMETLLDGALKDTAIAPEAADPKIAANERVLLQRRITSATARLNIRIDALNTLKHKGMTTAEVKKDAESKAGLATKSQKNIQRWEDLILVCLADPRQLVAHWEDIVGETRARVNSNIGIQTLSTALLADLGITADRLPIDANDERGIVRRYVPKNSLPLADQSAGLRLKSYVDLLLNIAAAADYTDSLNRAPVTQAASPPVPASASDSGDGSKQKWKGVDAAWNWTGWLALSGLGITALLLWQMRAAHNAAATRPGWRAIMAVWLAVGCAYAMAACYANTAALNDREYVKQRIINDFQGEAKIWQDSSPAWFLGSPFSMLLVERVKELPEKDRTQGEEGPRSLGRPWGAFLVFVGLFTALGWCGLLAWRDLFRRHDAAERALLAQARLRMLADFNQGLDAAFKQWSQTTTVNEKSFIQRMLRAVDLRLKETALKETDKHETLAATVAKDEQKLETRQDLLKRLEKCAAQTAGTATQLRTTAFKTFQL